jgi:integrase
VQPILDLAGPRGKNNRRGLSLLVDVPFLDRPRGYKKPPEDAYTIDEAQHILRACDVARLPAIDGLSAPAWWRGMFSTAAYVGLRVGTLLAMQWEWIEGEWLVVPPAGYKRAEPKRLYLNQSARAVLDALRDPVRRLVFPWPHVKTTLYDQCKAIIDAAGLPEHRRFRFHGFRKLFATEAAELNPIVAQMALGHASIRTTQDHYLASRLQQRTLEQLPKIEPLDDPRQGRLF